MSTPALARLNHGLRDAISFPELTCLLVSTRCLSADPKARGLWERYWRDAQKVCALTKVGTVPYKGIPLINTRQKIIKLADESQFGWATVQEHVSDELADDPQRSKKLRREPLLRLKHFKR